MTKHMRNMLIFVILLFGTIFGFKVFQNVMMNRFFKSQQIIISTVSATKASHADWEPRVKVTGSTRTVKGVDVTTELSGMIREIQFTPGSDVQEGDLLVQLDIDTDVAQLKALEAKAKYAAITYQRDTAQYKIGAVSKEQLDSDESNYNSSAQDVISQKATIAKKTIRAPFSGRLGISAVNLGEFINAGQKVVNLQTLDPIFVDFFVPQNMLARFQPDQVVSIKADAFPDIEFTGKVTTVNPEVDKSTRNIEIEATIPNENKQLLPGMFVDVTVTTGKPTSFITLPITALSFNSYGDIVSILHPNGKDKKGHDLWKVSQVFVTTGERRGDQIAVLQGVKEGDLVVTSGQLKIKNNSIVIINNQITPSNDPDPHPREKT